MTESIYNVLGDRVRVLAAGGGSAFEMFEWQGPENSGPPLGWPGLRSHRSMVLGPPLIHNRMQERLRFLSSAAARAKGSSLKAGGCP